MLKKILIIIMLTNIIKAEELHFKRSDLERVKYLKSKRNVVQKRNVEIDNKKEEILYFINSLSKNEFEKIYQNVIDYLDSRNMKTVRVLKKENYKIFLEENYKRMLSAIAYTESGFKYKEGLIDKDDVSYFQINIKKNIWNLNKLEEMSKKENLTREMLIENYELAGKIALHILLYNITLYADGKEIKELNEKEMINFIATYNHPYELKEDYKRVVKSFLL